MSRIVVTRIGSADRRGAFETVLRSLVLSRDEPGPRLRRGRGARTQEADSLSAELSGIIAGSVQIAEAVIPLPPSVDISSLRAFGYPYFGLYIYKTVDFYLAIRCGPIGQNGQGGHSHNDQLSIDLSIGGNEVLRDPGTYLYTPIPVRRNEYRSVIAHNGPRLAEREPCDLSAGLFTLRCGLVGDVVHFGEREFAGRLLGPGAELVRKVSISDERILITDYAKGCDGESARLRNTLEGVPPLPYSPGYGIRTDAAARAEQ